MMVVGRGDPIPKEVYGYSFGELFGLYRKATDPAMQELVNLLRDGQIIPLKKQVENLCVY